MSTPVFDPDDFTEALVGNAAVGLFGEQHRDVRLVNLHHPDQCVGHPCCVHRPSAHHMQSWDLNWRDDLKIMERLCPAHGVGHPDPDDLAFHARNGTDISRHNCCGCCHQ